MSLSQLVFAPPQTTPIEERGDDDLLSADKEEVEEREVEEGSAT